MKKSIQIFIEIGSYLSALMFLGGFLLAIDLALSRNVLWLAKYNLFYLGVDLLRAWFAIQILLPWFVNQEDFTPEAKLKFWVVIYIMVCLDSFWASGPWGLCR